MRKITLMATAATALTAVMAFAAPANADRICREVCDEGFCRTRCFDNGDRIYRYDRDRRPGIEFRGPGVGVEIGR
jgi:hypothetical protein